MMKPRSNGMMKGSEDIMMNLLDDSSGTDELQLPPLKGKKQIRRKKNNYGPGPSSSEGLCNMWTFVKMLIVLLLVCSVTVLGFISVWLSGQVKDLQSKLEDVERNRDMNIGNVEFEKKIKDVKHALAEMRNGTRGLNFVVKTLEDVTNKVNKMNADRKESSNAKTMEEVQTLSKHVKSISESVAGLGVDVKAMKSVVDGFEQYKKTLQEQMKELSKQNSKMIGTGGRETSAAGQTDLPVKIETLTETVQALLQTNNTVWSELSNQKSILSKQKDAIDKLENYTNFLQNKLDSLTSDHSSIIQEHNNMDHREGSTGGIDSEQVKVIVHQMIADMGLANKTGSSSSLDNLLQRVDNVSATVRLLKKKFTEMKSPDASFLDSELNDISAIQGNIETMNKTLGILTMDFHTLMTKVTSQQNSLNNVTHTVSALQHFASILEKDHKIFQSGMGEVTASSSKTTPTATQFTTIKEGQQPTQSIDVTETPAAQNKPPTANTESHVTVTLPIDNLILNGSGSYDDKGIVKYRWEQQRGPRELQLQHSDQSVCTATGEIVPGTYVFELQVWDKEHLSSTMGLVVDVTAGLTTLSTLSSSSPGVPLHRYINMSLVQNPAALDLGVRRWDKDGDGLVDPRDMPDYMPDPPNPADLRKFDFNGDQLYSKEELAVALGFKPWPKDKLDSQPKIDNS